MGELNIYKLGEGQGTGKKQDTVLSQCDSTVSCW